MKDKDKTKEQLVNELVELRQRIARLEASETLGKGAEEQVPVANERLQYLLSSTSAVIYAAKTSGDYGVTFISENVTQMVGYKPREFLEESSFWTDHVHPEDVQRILAELPRIFEQERYAYEYRFRHKDGRYIWVRDEMKLVRDEEGRPLEIIGYWVDITERKRGEEALRQSEERLRTIFAANPDCTYLTDAEGSILYANPALLELVRLSLEQVQQKNAMDFFAGDDPEKLLQAAARLQAGEKVRGLETQARIATGEVRDYEIHAIPLREKETVTAILSVARDITERKRAEEALRRSLEETARGQRLLLALSQAAQAVERARTPEEVYQTIGDEVVRLGYHALVFTLTDDRVHLTLSHHTFELAPLRAAEKLAGRSAQGYRFPLVPDGFFQRIIARGESTFTGRTAEHMAETLPEPLRPLAGQLAALLGLEQSIVAPLAVGGETHGLLVVTGAGLTETDVPAVTAFANQAAIAIENARLYEAEAQRRHEAETLRQTAMAFTSTLDLGETLDRILQQLHGVVAYDDASVELLQDDHLEIVGRRGFAVPSIVIGFRFPVPGNTPHTRVIESGEPVILADAQAAHAPFRELPHDHFRSWLGVPMRFRERIIGMIALDSTEPDHFTADHARVAAAFANQAAVAIENAQLYQETVRRLKEAETLGAVTTALTRSLDLDQVLHSIVVSATRLISASTGGVIHLVDEATRKLIPRATVAPGVNAQEKLEMSIGEGIAGLVVQEERLINVPNAEEDPCFLGVDTFSPNKSLLTAPLLIDKDCIGTLSLNSDQVGAFSADDEWLLMTLAAQAAVAVKNARLFEQVQRDAETKATLLDEVNHRVKNNLSAIVGLLYAERRHAAMEDQAVYQSVIQKMSNRVQGLDTVHSLLSASEWAPLSLSELAGQVIRSSLQMLPRDKSVSIDVTPSPVRVTPDQAHDLALVINELATNTIEHALEDRQAAQITVRIELDGDTVLFEFRDDGPGYPEEVLQLERHNVGFYLIQRIVRKTLRGELALHSDCGAVTTIRFKNQAKAFWFLKPKGSN